MRHTCPICGSRLRPLDVPYHYFCDQCTLYYKTHYGKLSRPFPFPPWDLVRRSGVKPPPSVQEEGEGGEKAVETVGGEVEVSAAERKWIRDVVARLTSNPAVRNEAAQIIMGLGTKYKDWWDMVRMLRSKTGVHIDKIHRIMYECYLTNQEFQKELEKEGVIFPFMPQYGQLALGLYRPR